MTIVRVLGIALLTNLFVSEVHAQALLFHCPVEGLFSAPPLIADMPNPSAGWDFFLDEATIQEVVLSSAPKRNGFWLITCRIGLGAKGTTIEITAHISGTRSCQISPNGGSIISQRDGSQSCLVNKSNADMRDHCTITCR